MGLFTNLTSALIAGRSAQKGGAAVGRQERGIAEAAAAKAVQEQEAAMAKALIERQRADNDTDRVTLEGQRVDLEGRRVGFDQKKSDQAGEDNDYKKSQRPVAEKLTASIINRNNSSAAASRRGPAGGSGPKAPTASAQRADRNELAMDAVRSQAVREGIDVTKLDGKGLAALAERAVKRIGADPKQQARAAASGASMDDYYSAVQTMQRAAKGDPLLEIIERSLNRPPAK